MPRKNPEASAVVEPKLAKNTPVVIPKTTNTEELPIGHTVRKPTDKSRVGEPELISVGEPLFVDAEHAAMMAFMEEPVTIRPTRASDPKETVFEINVNGRPELFRLNEEKTVKRYYVNRMLEMKVTTYGNVEKTNDEGIKFYDYPPMTCLKYEFEVVRDANKVGPDWLRAMRAMAG